MDRKVRSASGTGPTKIKLRKGNMNSTVKVVVLVVVIVACLGFVVMRFVGGKKSSSGDQIAGGGEVQMYCLDCKKPYKAKLSEEEATPLMMAGINANPKAKCPMCGKNAGVCAIKCAACGAIVPSPGMQVLMMPAGANGMKPPKCPKCGKILKPAAGSMPGAPAAP